MKREKLNTINERDNEFLLSDRIAKIRAINEQYNLLENWGTSKGARLEKKIAEVLKMQIMTE